uniref:Endonuclease/exonuclease/phosphatase domain-containing protein n=1 Tax=Amphilophus citrinellus TaxID=61819 RepID=A0A3Q0S4P9_AMPCI
MILFNRFPGKVIDHTSDINGHWLIVITEINDENFILVCVYGYNERGKNKMVISDLCKHITDSMHAYSTNKIIVGGDFNLVPDLWLDRNPPKVKYHKYDDLLAELMNSANLIDYWRVKNPGSLRFSWFHCILLLPVLSTSPLLLSPFCMAVMLLYQSCSES